MTGSPEAGVVGSEQAYTRVRVHLTTMLAAISATPPCGDKCRVAAHAQPLERLGQVRLELLRRVGGRRCGAQAGYAALTGGLTQRRHVDLLRLRRLGDGGAER